MAAPLHELLNGGNFIRPEELATGLGVAKPTIYLWAKKGVLPCVRLQGCVRFDPGEIKAWLEERQVPASGQPGEQPRRAPEYIGEDAWKN